MKRTPSIFILPLLALGGCAGSMAPASISAPIDVQILAINDFHGNLEPPGIEIEVDGGNGATAKLPAGGAAFLAAAAKALRAEAQHSMTVSAGDMIGASPLASALFLDEPTIGAMELAGVEYNAVGNHEFDKGVEELVRMQRGGCEQHASRRACGLEPFDGASFDFLAANVLTEQGDTLFPGAALKDFGPVQVGVIGMTLKETGTLVTPAGVEGVTFADEAATANRLVPALEAAGADAIVLLIHQGGRTMGGPDECPGLSGDILPIVEALDPRIDVVVSGHTHAAYVCNLARESAGPLLLTSAGRYGTLITDITLAFQPDGTFVGSAADNVIVAHGEGAYLASTLPVFAADPATAGLVARYVAAAQAEAARVVGTLAGVITRQGNASGEQTAGNLVADAQLRAGRAGGAEVAFINEGGLRADLAPAPKGEVTYGQIFAMQPFGNGVVVMTLTGAQLRALLEQQFASGANTAEQPNLLLPSEGFFFAYDLGRAPGERIVEMRLGGEPVDPDARYRVAVNSFLASGGDNFTVFRQGTDVVDVGLDLDAVEAYLADGADVPTFGRMEDRSR